ncbi:hypothetical protein CEE37_12845 [candidate division LCP-89 bacterium B3_LCP]|uniref:DUF2007 domain-containing protein n=1 Tax=candidate division LCP-89 bacterium B3_LCP TaxID=2012998 RepID=A0A532UU07_UNCL8|nr:MAG: hypothetical protein CEE37_12845 [candidate division LCP-89 bacterium B3_LCP]
MPFCPECRYEYLPEITQCPDCGSELVHELPEIRLQNQDVKWKSLPPVPGMVYAKMVTEVLDQREIPNYIQSLFGGGGLGVVTGGDFPGASAKIYVPEDFLAEAMAIRDEMMKEI